MYEMHYNIPFPFFSFTKTRIFFASSSIFIHTFIMKWLCSIMYMCIHQSNKRTFICGKMLKCLFCKVQFPVVILITTTKVVCFWLPLFQHKTVGDLITVVCSCKIVHWPINQHIHKWLWHRVKQQKDVRNKRQTKKKTNEKTTTAQHH